MIPIKTTIPANRVFHVRLAAAAIKSVSLVSLNYVWLKIQFCLHVSVLLDTILIL
jgi:hypothetical protein